MSTQRDQYGPDGCAQESSAMAVAAWEVSAAIDESIRQNKITHLPWSPERESDLLRRCVYHGDCKEAHEFWGWDWRVRLDREVSS